jgi:hypothetical protein
MVAESGIVGSGSTYFRALRRRDVGDISGGDRPVATTRTDLPTTLCRAATPDEALSRQLGSSNTIPKPVDAQTPVEFLTTWNLEQEAQSANEGFCP